MLSSRRHFCAPSARPLALALTALTLLGIVSTAQPAAAQTLLSDNFNTENGGVPTLGYSNFANFNVTSPYGVDLLGPGLFDNYPGNGLNVDLNGVGPGELTSKTAFALTPGVYTLGFSLGSSDNATDLATAALGTVYSQMFTVLPGAPLLTPYTETITVTTPTSANLSFISDTGGNAGAILDNVSLVRQNVAAVPEPAPLALLGLGLLPMGFVAARKRKA